MGETIIVIPMDDILRIEKKVNALIFNNAILFVTR